MFTKITRFNRHKEDKVLVINTDHIVSLTEIHTEPVCLYNEYGVVVEEREPVKEYLLVMTNGKVFHLNESNYNELVKVLVK